MMCEHDDGKDFFDLFKDLNPLEMNTILEPVVQFCIKNSYKKRDSSILL